MITFFKADFFCVKKLYKSVEKLSKVCNSMHGKKQSLAVYREFVSRDEIFVRANDYKKIFVHILFTYFFYVKNSIN